MLSFIEVTLILTDITLKALHSASKHDSIHMCELLHAVCEPLYSKCSADKSLTSIFYSWGPSRSGYHFCNSPCANTSCSVSPVLLWPWEMSTKVILSPPTSIAAAPPLLALYFAVRDGFIASTGWDGIVPLLFLKKNISPLILVQIRSWGTAAVDTGKADGTEILTPRWNPTEWRNQGLIWSQCPQAQTIWQPESDGFTKTIIHHFSPVSNQLAGLLWAAAPSLTVWHIDG